MKVEEIKNISADQLKRYQRWEWSREVLDACPSYVFCAAASMTSKNNHRYFPEMTLIMAYFRGEQMSFCHPERELAAITNKVIRKSSFNLNFVNKIYAEWSPEIKKLSQLYTNFKEKISDLPDAELLDLYEKVIKKSCETLGLAIFIDAIAVGKNKLAENNFQHFLETRDEKSKFGQYYGLLTKPTKPSFINRFESEIRKLPAQINNQNRALAKILCDFSWIRSSYAHYAPIDREYVEGEIKHLTKAKPIPPDLAEQKEKLKNLLEVPPEIDNQLQLMTHLSGWQDERKEMCLRSIEVTSVFLDEVERRLHIDKNVLEWIFPPEFRDLFAGDIDLDKIKQRRREFIMFQRDYEFEVMMGARSGKIFTSLFPQDDAADVKRLKGLAASTGKAGGEVKILLSSRSEKKMKPGDILVAGMTRPDYMPAIRKAGAIVTDEGGITCHAAIIARELGIPCVVATRRATRALKDGDLVEVNGNRGIVNVLNK